MHARGGPSALRFESMGEALVDEVAGTLLDVVAEG
jgi:hypothetical protein